MSLNCQKPERDRLMCVCLSTHRCGKPTENNSWTWQLNDEVDWFRNTIESPATNNDRVVKLQMSCSNASGYLDYLQRGHILWEWLTVNPQPVASQTSIGKVKWQLEKFSKPLITCPARVMAKGFDSQSSVTGFRRSSGAVDAHWWWFIKNDGNTYQCLQNYFWWLLGCSYHILSNFLKVSSLLNELWEHPYIKSSNVLWYKLRVFLYRSMRTEICTSQTVFGE